MKRECGLVLFALLLVVQAAAQATAGNDAPATREDVTKLFDLMHVQEQTKSAMDSMMKQQRVMIHDSIRKRHPETTDAELKRMDSFVDDFIRDFPIAKMLDDMIPVYQRHLTRGNVDDMAQFYASPTGQKLLREMPAIMSESMQAMMAHMQESMEKMMDRAEKMAEEERQKTAVPASPKN